MSLSQASDKTVSEIFYIVERIEDIADAKSRNVKSRAGVSIFIKWEGYPLSDNTWEPIENLNLVNAVDMLEGLYTNPKVNVNSRKRILIDKAVEYIRRKKKRIQKAEEARQKKKNKRRKKNSKKAERVGKDSRKGRNAKQKQVIEYLLDMHEHSQKEKSNGKKSGEHRFGLGIGKGLAFPGVQHENSQSTKSTNLKGHEVQSQLPLTPGPDSRGFGKIKRRVPLEKGSPGYAEKVSVNMSIENTQINQKSLKKPNIINQTSEETKQKRKKIKKIKYNKSLKKQKSLKKPKKKAKEHLISSMIQNSIIQEIGSKRLPPLEAESPEPPKKTLSKIFQQKSPNTATASEADPPSRLTPSQFKQSFLLSEGSEKVQKEGIAIKLIPDLSPNEMFRNAGKEIDSKHDSLMDLYSFSQSKKGSPGRQEKSIDKSLFLGDANRQELAENLKEGVEKEIESNKETHSTNLHYSLKKNMHDDAKKKGNFDEKINENQLVLRNFESSQKKNVDLRNGPTWVAEVFWNFIFCPSKRVELDNFISSKVRLPKKPNASKLAETKDSSICKKRDLDKFQKPNEKKPKKNIHSVLNQNNWISFLCSDTLDWTYIHRSTDQKISYGFMYVDVCYDPQKEQIFLIKKHFIETLSDNIQDFQVEEYEYSEEGEVKVQKPVFKIRQFVATEKIELEKELQELIKRDGATGKGLVQRIVDLVGNLFRWAALPVVDCVYEACGAL